MSIDQLSTTIMSSGSYGKHLDPTFAFKKQLGLYLCPQSASNRLVSKFNEDQIWMHKSKNYIRKTFVAIPKELSLHENHAEKLEHEDSTQSMLQSKTEYSTKLLISTKKGKTKAIKAKKCKKRKIKMRGGDWICLHCRNLNFHFRLQCNLCTVIRKN